jgi:hypothetical protein
MNPDYYAFLLSERIAKTPEGYVICLGCVIARTGFQGYRVSDLDPDSLISLGLADRYADPDEVVQLYRSEDEVFSPATIASFEGKSVTDSHPDEFVDIDSHAELSKGHVQNVRRGDEPLADGNIPLLADLIITDPGLADDVIAGRKRELSCGYSYVLSLEGNRLSQTNITGNHVAVVDRARAGHEARINDSVDAATTPTRKPTMKSIKDMLIGLGLKAMATDNADPEQIAAAARAFASDEESEEKEEKKEEAKDEMSEIKDALKSICDRLDALEKPEESEDSEEEKKDDEKSEDEAESEESEEGEAEDEDESKAKDGFVSHANDLDVLKAIKPLIAKSKDAELKKAFNVALSKASDSKRGGTPKDSYAAAKSAAGKSDAKDSQENIIDRLNKRAQAAYRGEKEVK